MSNRCTEERFLDTVKTHEMIILMDNGLYRHIRFKRPGTYTCYFDLITWPGKLCYTGDMLTFIFSRIEDMFQFFPMDKNDWNYKGENVLSINPHYWSEKLLAAPIDSMSNGYKEFSQDKFNEVIKEYYDNYIEENACDEEFKKTLWERIEEEVLGPENEQDAYDKATDFMYGGFQFRDFWERNLKEFTYHYIFACYAIQWGIQHYKEYKRRVSNNEQVQYGETTTENIPCIKIQR